MDFLDPKKKRAHAVRLYVGYALVAVALLIGTGILALEAYGFDFNRKTGTVIQNGLVFVDAHPDVADIYINGTNKGKTDNRLVIPEGDYAIELRRTGYRTWKNSFHLGGGLIERFVYPFLFPETLVTKNVEQYTTSPGLVTESPDRHWLVVQQPTIFTSFEVFDLNNNANPSTSFNLPTDLLTTSTGPQTVELTEWSTDNRRFIIKHTYTAGTEYILVDREAPVNSQNLTKLFAKPNIQFSLRDKKYDQYFAYDSVAKNLYTGELKAKQLTLQIEKVANFKSHGADDILYVTETELPTSKAIVKIKSGQDSYALRDLPKSPAYLLEMARFDNDWYVAAGAVQEGKVYVYRDPVDRLKQNDTPTPVTILKEDSPESLSFSTNTRFIALQSGSKFAVYDAESQRTLRYDTGLALKQGEKAVWMDGHRLLITVDYKLNVFDFDGTNKQILSTSDGTHLPFFDRDYKALFTVTPITPSQTKAGLLRTELKLTTNVQSNKSSSGF